jgi:hypothetical protein
MRSATASHLAALPREHCGASILLCHLPQFVSSFDHVSSHQGTQRSRLRCRRTYLVPALFHRALSLRELARAALPSSRRPWCTVSLEMFNYAHYSHYGSRRKIQAGQQPKLSLRGCCVRASGSASTDEGK